MARRIRVFFADGGELLYCGSPYGRVGEWLKPADCKSAAPCGLRRFESSPVHHLNSWRCGRKSPGSQIVAECF